MVTERNKVQRQRSESLLLDRGLSDVDRFELKRDKGVCFWFTGLSGAGKTSIANSLEQLLLSRGIQSYILDGDVIRSGLNRDLGFTIADRVENLRRIAEVAKLMVDAGVVTIVSCISPFVSERAAARSLFDEGKFVEVYIDTPIEVCESRDVKGLYKRARAGEIADFTGISSPYEPPISPECHVSGHVGSPEDRAEDIFRYLSETRIMSLDV